MENQKHPLLPIFAPEDIYGPKPAAAVCEDVVKIKDLREEQRVIEGVGDVFGKLYDGLGLGAAPGSAQADRPWNEALKTLVIARLGRRSVPTAFFPRPTGALSHSFFSSLQAAPSSS
jgi:hypothetical protein